MRVYAPFGDPRLPAQFPAKRTPEKSGEPDMSRRHIAYAVLVVASFVLNACAQPTAPVGTDTLCRGVQVGVGNKCETD